MLACRVNTLLDLGGRAGVVDSDPTREDGSGRLNGKETEYGRHHNEGPP